MATFHPELILHDTGPVPFYRPPGAAPEPPPAAPPDLLPCFAPARALRDRLLSDRRRLARLAARRRA